MRCKRIPRRVQSLTLNLVFGKINQQLRKFASVIAPFTTLLLAGQAWTQDIPIIDPILKNESGVEAEIKRIQSLPVPPLELIGPQSEEARQRSEFYMNLAKRTVTLRTVSDSSVRKQRILSLAAEAATSAKICDRGRLTESLRQLREEANQLPQHYIMFFIGQYGSEIVNRGIPTDDVAASQSVSTYVDFNPFFIQQFECDSKVKHDITGPDFTKHVETFVKVRDKQAENIQAILQGEKPRAEAMAAAWTARYNSLVKTIESQKKATVDLFVNQLPTIILIFCGFALCVIGVVRLFDASVQMEWVASGQVIQFASVMVLLIIVSTLSILQKIDGQTVGTLLGGIAGYVLSQGVGRAAARAVERQAAKQTDNK
ncbi:MAG TPA: hypothetical protein VJR03_13250 [Nitrospira sp.]|nr:hypothetical protein [Nitrospira sp.]